MDSLKDIRCPVCGEPVSAPCRVRPGRPGTYWDPPEPEEVEYDVDEFEYNCDCRSNIDENGTEDSRPRYKRNPSFHERLYHVLTTYAQQLEQARFEGFHRRRLILGQLAGSVRAVQDKVLELDEEGRAVYDKVNPLLEAYDNDIERQAEESTVDYEEPDYYDYESY